MPYKNNLCGTFSWFTVSNALLGSTNTQRVWNFLFNYSYINSTSRTIASTVDIRERKPKTGKKKKVTFVSTQCAQCHTMCTMSYNVHNVTQYAQCHTISSMSKNMNNVT